jgi:hypothetical protein
MWYNKSKFGFILRKCLNQKYLSDWKDTSESLKDGKLTTCLFLKTNFKLEKYLTLVKKYEYRKSICKLRTSAHRLLIETGRNTNILRNKRICKNCTNQEIEDETHFLTRCQKFSGERDELFKSISAKVENFTNLSDKNKLFWLLNCENQEILNCWKISLQKACLDYYYIFILYTLCIYSMFVCHVLSIFNSFPLAS